MVHHASRGRTISATRLLSVILDGIPDLGSDLRSESLLLTHAHPEIFDIYATSQERFLADVEAMALNIQSKLMSDLTFLIESDCGASNTHTRAIEILRALVDEFHNCQLDLADIRQLASERWLERVGAGH